MSPSQTIANDVLIGDTTTQYTNATTTEKQGSLLYGNRKPKHCGPLQQSMYTEA